MSKQIVTKNAAPQVVKAGQKTIIKVAKGQHIAVQDVVHDQFKVAGDVVAIKKGKQLHLKFADDTELQIEDFYTECGDNACSVTVAGKEAGGYSINSDTGIGASTTDGGQLIYAYGDYSILMSMASGDAGMTSALESLGNGTVAYAPAGASATAGIFPGSLAAVVWGLAAAGGVGSDGGGGGRDGGGGGRDGGGGGDVPSGDTTAPAAPTGIDVRDASDTGESNTDNKSLDTTPTVRVSFNTVAVNGTAAVVGDTVKLFAGVTQVGSAVLDAEDISAGFVDITPQNSLGADSTYNLTAKITDAAGNNSSASSAVSYVLDTTAPTIQALVAHSAEKTVVLTYSEALDSTNLPAVGDFAVTTGGVPNPVYSIAVNGATMTLTLTNVFAPGAVTVTYTATVGDQANAIQDLAGNDDNNGFSSGIVADGYVRGATVYTDTNNNGMADPDEDYFVGTTDATGNFFIPSGAPEGTIIAVGGINIDTGVPNTMPLKAPAGSTTINPLTTLVHAVIVANPGTSVTDATSSVATALGITLPAGASLISYDPISAGNLSAQKAAAQVATVVALAESATGSTGTAGSTVITNIVTQIQTASSSESTVSLSDASTLGAILSGTNVTDAVQSTIADASTTIGSATLISEISSAQSQYLDTIAPASPVTPDLTTASDTGSSNTDNVTKNTSLTVRIGVNNTATDGTAAVAGDTVILLDNGVQVASATLSASNITAGYVDIALSGLATGIHSFTGKITDQAGNPSVASVALGVVIDTAAPTAPTIHTVAGNDVVNASEKGAGITVSGAAEAGASVDVTWGGVTKTVTATGGNWTTSFAAGDVPDDGNASISAIATDVAGNASTTSSRAVIVDATPPAATITITGAEDNVTPTTGNITSGGTTDDNTLGLSGTVTGLGAGEVVVVYDGVTRLGTATVTDSNWTFTTSSLSNSAHNFTARVEDEVGNQGTASATYAVTVNATVPTTTAIIVAVADNAGTVVTDAVSNNGLTDDTTPTLSGTNTALAQDEQIVIYDGGVRLGVATANTDTSWTFAPSTLSPGAHSFTAVVEASGGNQGTTSTAFNITIDTTPPGAPIIGVIAGDDVISSSEQAAVISGTAEANASIAISLGGNTRTVVADNSGNWSYTLTDVDITAMEQESETLSVTATDVAGNIGNAATRNISVDTAAPNAPVFNAVSTDDAINAYEKLLGVNITGTAEANAKIALTIGGIVRSITADGSGNWTYALTTADYTAMGQGSETLSAIATDPVGNTSSAGSKTITIETLAPFLTAKLDPASDTGVANNDGKSNDPTPTLTGVSGPGTTITVKEGIATLGTATADATKGEWSVTTSELTNGPHVLTVSVTDLAGNTTTRTVNYTLDSVAPTAKFGSATDNVGSVTGALTSGATTDDTSLVLTGTNEVGSTVKVYNGTTELGSATVTGTSWSYTATIVNGTTYQFNVKETDAVGNTSEATSKFTVTGDTTAPTASLTDVTDDMGSVKGLLTNGAITDDTALVLSGTCEVGSTVKVYTGTTELGSATVTDTSWSYTATIVNGTTYQFNVKETDAAGNISDATSNFTVIGDTVSPSFTSGTATNFAENGSGTVYASVVTDATTVAYTLGGTDADLFNVDSSMGAVTFKAAPNFEAPADSGTDNVYNITVTASDAAGNQSSQSVAITVTNVNEAPTVSSAGTVSFAENGAGTVYTATATDPDAGTSLTYSLGGSDADLFDIDASTGVVTFKAAPNFEVPADAGGNNVYDITVTATDNGTGTLSDTTAVAITVTDVNEAPVIGSGSTGSVAENAATSTVIYTAQATDVDAGTVLTYSLSGSDASLLDINASTGAVTLKASANFEVKSSYSFNVIATDNGTGALSDTKAVTVSVTDVTDSGYVVDGYLSGATVFRDENGNDVLDNGEASTATNAVGLFNGLGGDITAPIVAFGGTDISTGVLFTGALSAPSGSTVVTPLTTLVRQLMDLGETAEAANTKVTSVFGLGSIDLGKTDPVASGNVDLYKAGAQVASLINSVAARGTDSVEEQSFSHAATRALSEALNRGDLSNATDLADASKLESILANLPIGAGDGIDPTGVRAIAASVAAGNSRIASMDTIDDMIGVQQAIQQAASSDAGIIITGALTLEGGTGLGGGFKSGDAIQLLIDASQIDFGTESGSVTVNLQSLGLGEAVPLILLNGQYQLETPVLIGNGLDADDASIVLTVENGVGFEATLTQTTGVDTIAPASPTLVSITDTDGNPIKDSITAKTSLTFNVTAESGSTVEIFSREGNLQAMSRSCSCPACCAFLEMSEDGSSTAQVLAAGILLGVATESATNPGKFSLTVDALHDGAYSIIATSTDRAGNVSLAMDSPTIIIDTSAPEAPSITDVTNANNDNDVDTGTELTLTISAEPEADVEVFQAQDSIGFASESATSGVYTIITAALADGGYAFSAQATDAAGNVSAVSVTKQYTLDTLAPAVDPTEFTLEENTTAVGGLSADEDVSWQLGSGQDSALFTLSGAQLSFITAPDFEAKQGVYQVQVTAYDDAGNATEQTLTVTVTDVNEAPTAEGTIAAQTAVTNKVFALDLSGYFADEDANSTLSYTASGLPTGLSINATSGVISGTVMEDQSPATVTVTASDGSMSAQQSFDLAVYGTPRVQSFTVSDPTGDTGAGRQGESLTFTLTLTEAVSVTGTPIISVTMGNQTVTGTYDSGASTPAVRTLVFTGAAPSGGATSATLTSIDLTGASVTGLTGNQSLNTTVTGQTADYRLDNTAPVFSTATSVTADEEQATLLAAVAADDADATYSLKSGEIDDAAALTIDASTGAVTLSTGELDYETKPMYSFTVVATDAVGNTAEQTITVNLNDVVEDAGAPTLLSSNIDGPADFDGREKLTFTFSEAIQAGTGSIVIRTADGRLVESFDVATSPGVEIDGAVVTLTPTWALESSADHTITVDAGAVEDTAGNAFAGVSETNALVFRTGAESVVNLHEQPFANSFPGNNRETIGEHTLVYVRTTYADQLNAPWDLTAWMYDNATMDEFWAYNSNGRLSVTSSFAPMLTLDTTMAFHQMTGVRSWDEGIGFARSLGYDFSNYDAGVVGNNDWPTGVSFGGGKYIYNAWRGSAVLWHEAGHEIGFSHPITIATPYDIDRIGWEGHSRMGGGPSHYGLAEKLKAGWLEWDSIVTDPAAGEYRIHPFDAGYLNQNGAYGFYVNSSAEGFSGNGFDWFVQHRSSQIAERDGTDEADLSDELILVRVGGNARLQDHIELGETARIPESNTYVTALSKGDGFLEAAVRHGVVAEDGSFLENIAPEVSFTATASAVQPGGSVTFAADAYDAEGNALTYTWSFSDGVTGSSPTFTRTFDQTTAGTVTATLTANDLRTGITSISADITVGAAATDSTVLTAGSLSSEATRAKPLVTIQTRDAFAEESGDTATLVLERFGTSLADPLTVSLSYAGTGLADVTTASLPQTVTFAAGAKEVELVVSMLTDDAVEAVEALTVSLNAADTYDVSGSDNTARVNLLDDDLPIVRIATLDGVASEAGRDSGTFILTRTGSVAEALTVNYNSFGTALHGTDYAALSGEVTFSAGERSTILTIQPVDNDAGEAIETVSIMLTDFSESYDVDGNAFVASLDIHDNDRPHVQAYVTGNVVEGGTVGVIVEALGKPGETVTVAYDLTGSATAGVDYQTPAGSVDVTIGADGRGTRVVNFATNDDRDVEPEEFVQLTVRESADYGIGTDRVATFVVRDNDSSLPTVMISPYSDYLTEGDTGGLRFYIQRSNTSGDLVVNYDLTGTATPDVDYSGLSGSVTIADGESGATITATPIDDAIVEGNETITVSLAAADDYRLGIANTATLAIADNDSGEYGFGFDLVDRELTWNLLGDSYPAPEGIEVMTPLRVADIDPEAFTYAFDGGSINTKDAAATVNPYTVDATSGLSFWLETYDDGFTKAVQVELTDTANGLSVRAVEAGYTTGDARGTDWIGTRSSQSVADGADSAGYGVSVIKAVGDAIPAAVIGEAAYQPVLRSTLAVAETQDPDGNIRDIAVQIVPVPLTFGTESVSGAGYTPTTPILAGQTFTTGSLGGRDTVESISINGLSASVDVSQLVLKVWSNNGDASTLAPAELIATSTTARRSQDTDQVVFEFGGEQLASDAVYAFTLADSDGVGLPFTGMLVTPADRQPGDSQAFGDEVVGLVETRWSGSGAFDNEDWTGTPSHQEFWTQTASAENIGSNYSRRVTGLLEPDVSGDYTFWVAGDDNARLYLGTDASEGSKALIASLSDWTNPQQWDKYPEEQQSATVSLQAGEQYWFEVQQYEGGGGDHVSVAWQGPGMDDKAIITAENFAAVQPVDAAADLSFTVTMTGTANTALDQPVSVRVGVDRSVYHSATGNNIDWTLLDPTTNQPIDAQTVVFQPGETEKFVRVRVNADAYPEQGESFTLSLANPMGIGLAPSLGSLRVEITDRTAATAGVEVANRYVRFAADESLVSEADGSVPNLLVALDRPAGNQPITVTLDLAGSATAGDDYSIGSTTLTFQPGETAKSLDLALIADEVGEGLEAIVVSIASTSGALAIGPETHTVLILDKDRPQVQTSMGFAAQGDDAGSVLATATATVADGRSTSIWSLVGGNITREGQATPAFAVDSNGVVTLTNPDALPDGSNAVQLTVRVTDDQGGQADGLVNVVVNGIQALKEERWSGSAAFEASDGEGSDAFYGDGGATSLGQDLTTPPTYTGLLDTTASAVDVGNDFTRRLRGFLEPDVDGDYTFWIAADDNARLYLGTDATEASKQLIASLSDWTDPQEWDKYPDEQQSQVITLEAGKKYWFEVLHYDVGGGDHVAVAWQGPGMAEKALITADNFGPIVPEASFAAYQPSLIENSVISMATLDAAIGTDTGLTPTIASGERTRDASLTLTGTADPAATVVIYDGLTPIGTAARSGEAWSFTTPELANGEHSLSARVVDAAGTTHITRSMSVDVSTNVTVTAQPVQTVDSVASLSAAADTSLITLHDISGLGDGTASFVDGDPAVSDLLMADLKTGLLQLVNRGPASAVTSANVAVTPVSVSADGRYAVFMSDAVTAFGDGGVAFTDATPEQTQTDIFVYDRETNGVRLATWSGNESTTASRGASPVGITPDGAYLVYTTEHIETIGDFTAPAKLVWELLEDDYATPQGNTKVTEERVADLDLSTLEIRLDGRTDGSPAVVRQDTVDTSVAGQLTFWVQSSEGTRAVKLQLTDTATGIEVKALTAATATPTTAWATTDTISTGTGNGVGSMSAIDGNAGVGQTFTTGSLDAGTRLNSITIQGPSSGASGTQYTLKVWKNEGDFNTFAPGELVARSINSNSIPNGGSGVFEFSGEELDPNTVYLFSLSSSTGDHVGFRSSITNDSATRLADGRLLARSLNSSYDVAFTLDLSDTPLIADPSGIDWTSSGTADLSIQSADVATRGTDGGVGLTTLSVGPDDTSDQMQREVPTDNLPPATDIVAFNLATGEQTLLSHGVTGSGASGAADVSDVTLSSDGRYVLFRAVDATRLGNDGVAFTDVSPHAADWFATNIQTGEIRLLTPSVTDAMEGAGASATLLGTSADGTQAILSSNDVTAFGFSDASPGTADLFTIGLDDGVIRLISRAASDFATTSSGQAVNVEKIVGNHVYFTAADATKLGFASDDATDRNDLFRYDLRTSEVQLLSHAIGDPSAALGGNYEPNTLTVSNDGRYVAFVSDLRGDTGGFDVRIGGDALLLTDTETGAIRMLNSDDNAGRVLSYSAWAGVGRFPKFFVGDEGKLVWQSSYLYYVNGVRGEIADRAQFNEGVVLFDFSFGLNSGGMDQSNKLLSHSASNVNGLAIGAFAQLVGVSPDGQLAYFTANDARWFGNDGKAFTDAYPSVKDLFAVDLATRDIDLISGQDGVSDGQPVTFKGITESGQVVFTQPAQKLVWSLLASAYPGADGQPRATVLKVADFVPSAFVYTLNGDYITNKNGVGAVNLQSITTTTIDTGTQKSFWVEVHEGGFTKAVRLVVSDTADGLLVTATEARYTSGDQRGTNWFNTGTAATVATSASAEGYGISAIVAVDDDIPAAVRGEAVYGPPPVTGDTLVDLWINAMSLIDLDSGDDTAGGQDGTNTDNITSKQDFTLRARVLPEQEVTLLENGVAVTGGTVTADADGYVSWQLTGVAIGEYTYSLLDSEQQIPVVLDGSLGSSSLTVTVLPAVNVTGGSGNDTLVGNEVANTLTGGSGNDFFVFASPLGNGNVDTITDFTSGDKIHLSNSIFDDLFNTDDVLDTSLFFLGNGAQDSTHRVIYNQDVGTLSYDADGSGGQAALVFAYLENMPQSLTNADFFVI